MRHVSKALLKYNERVGDTPYISITNEQDEVGVARTEDRIRRGVEGINQQ